MSTPYHLIAYAHVYVCKCINCERKKNLQFEILAIKTRPTVANFITVAQGIKYRRHMFLGIKRILRNTLGYNYC